jgi:hypothetical protein
VEGVRIYMNEGTKEEGRMEDRKEREEGTKNERRKESDLRRGV